ncbi:MAG: OmpA family protein [Flavobacteriales bacterium]
MNHPIKLFMLLWLAFAASNSFSQSTSIEEDRGDVFLESFEFDRAITLYTEAYSNDSNNVQLTRKIADAYRRKGDLASSSPWYQKTLTLDTTRQEDMLYYAESLKTLKRYDESLVWYEKYNELQPKDLRAENHLANSRYYEELAEDSLMYLVNKLDFNNKKPAFGVTKYNQKLVFSATGFENQKFNKTNPWNNLPYLDVYQANIDENKQAVDIEPINEINSKYNDGPAHFDENSQTMFVTRNNMRRGKPVKDKTGSVNLKIYTSKLENGQWSEIEELPFNSNDYSTGHPSVTKDGQFLYFASNKPGGEGGTDIYVSEKVNDTWAHPNNLGDNVNTKGNELFPYVDDNNILYFSSTGHVGLGGLDIFKIDLDSLKTDEPVNVGYPLNSPKDDFSILFEEVDKSGYFCSNRDRGFSDDIFYFEVNNPLRKIYAGLIESSLPENSLAGNTLIVRNLDTDEEFPIILDDEGKFEFEALPGNTYELAYQKEDVEEILLVKTVEETVEEEFENLGIFTIQERLDVTISDDGNELEINDKLFKRFGEDGMFITEQGDSLSEIDIMDLLTKNLNGNDIELNNALYKLNPETKSYVQEDGETIDDMELESLLVSQIFANPLDMNDDSVLAGTEPVDTKPELAQEKSTSLDIENLSALEWVEQTLDKEALTEKELMELESENEADEVPTESLSVTNPEKYILASKEDLKIALNEKGLQNIYFDFDQSAIRQDAKPVLDELASMLTVNPGVNLYVNAHTDARGSNDYNDALSESRAESVRKYLSNRGIDPSRLQLSWFGEEQLTNACADGVNCEENAHELNRRAAFALAGEPTASNSNDYIKEDSNTSDNVMLQPGSTDAELASAEGIQQIYYNFDKHNIRPDAQTILNEVAKSMSNNGKEIVINAHTDARGSSAYNAALSEKRAEAAKQYLIDKGISADKISINWAGETQLSNGCSDGISCNTNEHQRNRRATLVWK